MPQDIQEHQLRKGVCDLWPLKGTYRDGKNTSRQQRPYGGIWCKKQNRYLPVLSVLVLQAELCAGAHKFCFQVIWEVSFFLACWDPVTKTSVTLKHTSDCWLLSFTRLWEEPDCWGWRRQAPSLPCPKQSTHAFDTYIQISFRIRCYFCHFVNTENKKGD